MVKHIIEMVQISNLFDLGCNYIQINPKKMQLNVHKWMSPE